jgi:hypothetical protein
MQIIIIPVVLILVSLSYSNIANAEDPPFVLKWTYSTSQDASGGIGPLAVDINNDGIMEIFACGDNNPSSDKIYCISGNNGALRWSTTLPYSTVAHNPMEIYDLDNDGDYELIQPSPSGLMVLNAEDGTLYWKNSGIKSSEAHQLVLDTDKNGYPYIYTCNADDTSPYSARLRKVDGRTGTILISKEIYYPCHGGLSAADVDNDGDFEIFMSDRSTGNGKGIQCYDADTLSLIWYKKNIYCASNLPVIIDVNNDGILDVVVSQQRTNNAGIYCLDGRNGNYITGKYQDAISGLATHQAFPIHDIDNDGNLEIATCAYSNVKIFDIGKWSIEATLAFGGKPPYYANVMGDGNLEIIISEEVSSIKIYDNKYQLIHTIPNSPSYASTVQDIDNDGLNELITISGEGTIKVYDTTATASNPLPRTNTNHYSERNTRTGTYTPPPYGTAANNKLPIITNPNPTNGLNKVPISISSLTITIDDPEGDLFYYTIETSPDIGSRKMPGAKSGVKTCTISGLASSTTYKWYVNVTDDERWTRKTYSFTTESSQDPYSPQISNIITTVSDPIDVQSGFGWEKISCEVTDNIGVNTVSLIITYPNGKTYSYSTINQPNSNIYYYNTSYTQHGDYSYYFKALDSSGNLKNSKSYQLSIPPNWDINNDRKCNILDQTMISLLYDKTGNPGWIREDVDNNGRITLTDIVSISNHYGEEW